MSTRDPADKVVPLRGRRCPVCRKPTLDAWRPFCSKRCADIDLGRWLTGIYRVPTDEEAGTENDTGTDTGDE